MELEQVELHNIPLPTTGGQVTGEVKMPSGVMDKPVIQDNRDGTVSINYEPREEGLHELYIKYNAEHVQGIKSLPASPSNLATLDLVLNLVINLGLLAGCQPSNKLGKPTQSSSKHGS